MKLEQRRLVPADYIVPDFLCRFEASYYEEDPHGPRRRFTCLVEVKSSSAVKFKLGGAHLRRLRSFADFLNLPLLFAVRYREHDFRPFWVIEQDNRVRSTFSLSAEAFDRDLHCILWNAYQLGIEPSAKLISTWERHQTSGVQHAEFGGLHSFAIATSRGIHTLTDSDATFAKIMFEAFAPGAPKVSVSGTRTTETSGIEFALPSLIEILFVIDHQLRHNLMNDDGTSAPPPLWGPSSWADDVREMSEALLARLIDARVLVKWAWDRERDVLRWKTLSSA